MEWKCLQCETINNGSSCIICGAERPVAKPVFQPTPGAEPLQRGAITAPKKAPAPGFGRIYPSAETRAFAPIPGKTPDAPRPPVEAAPSKYVGVTEASKPKSNKKLMIVLIAVLTVLLLLVAGVFALDASYNRAKGLLESGSYGEARDILSGIKFYRNSETLLKECDYSEAEYALHIGNVQQARDIYISLGNYADANSKVMECDYRLAITEMNNGNYSAAREKLSAISHYKDVPSVLQECDYREAISFMNNRKYEEAKAIFDRLGDYQNAAEYIDECDYQVAIGWLNEGDDKLFSAYDIFEQLDDYKESESYLDTAITKLYDTGVALYQKDSFDDAKKYFDKVPNEQRAEDYLLLIRAHDGEELDIDDLMPLAGFEDASTILQGNSYLQSYLMGVWRSGSTILEFYGNGSGTTCNSDLPQQKGSYYKLEDGAHHYSYDESTWTKCWSYTIISADRLRIDCTDGTVYIFDRD